MSEVYSEELERVAESDRLEDIRRRRTVTFLIAALITMLLTLCGLGYFYFRVVGSTQDYEPVIQKGYSLQFIREYYGFGKGPNEQFVRPHDVSMTPNGEIVVADTQNRRVLLMTRDGDLVAQVEEGKEWGPGQLGMPNGVAAGPDGRIYVADGGGTGPHGKLIVFSPNLSRVETEVVFPPTDPPIMPRIYGDELYVTCAAGVKVFGLDGTLLREWGGTVGKGQDEFSYPNGIVKRDDGSVVVAESNNRRIKFYDRRGTLESIVGTPPVGMDDNSPTMFNLPMGLAEDEDGRLYLADAWGYNIRVLDAKGAELAALGDSGNGEGQFDAPAGLTYIGNREFLLADELNHRIVRLRITVPGAGVSGLPGWLGENTLVRTCAWVVPLLVLLLAIAYAVSRARTRRAVEQASQRPQSDPVKEP